MPVNDPDVGSYVPRDAALRVIMFTDLKDSTEMTTRLGETKAMHLLRIHNAFTRNALREHEGREVKHLGDGIMASFASIAQALDCAISIQKTLASFNSENAETPLRLRIGLSAGEPVEDDNDLFGATVQLAARLCAHAKPDQILATRDVLEHYDGAASLFTNLGLVRPKGFDQAIPVFEVHWRGVD